MYNRRFKSILLSGLSASAAILMGSAGHAQTTSATGTAAGTIVNNTASVSYSVGGTPQTAQSNTATFVVDKKVNLTVAELGGTDTQTALGATDQVTTFTVTNLTNAIQDFRLTADQQSVSIPILGVDNFDVTNVRIFVDSNGNGVYDAGVDTRSYIDELAPDATATVFIVADVPNAPGENVAIVSLNAIAAAGGTSGSLGSDLVATSTLTPDSPTTVDIVFADGGGIGDLPRNGQARAFDAYQISTAAVTMTKSAVVISDPYDLAVNPKAIPGATIRYCMIVSNAGPGAATAVNVTDSLPANVTFVSGSLNVGGTGAGGVCGAGGTQEDDDAVGPDESDPNGGSFDGTTVRAMLPLLAAPVLGIPVPLAVTFLATIN
ncbi:DUF11 domain-containing protein [Sphingomonas abietis]|uniref:DUF11 domain-containing protein n=1 Tax=Sphingomonas abietis TaxID=3012344 RepID=A0ABY7NQB0_9SPHN|nr:DUF11 domain-containing protein [Sphingomonas abietis]WBO23150.1 DUF11 domain-containing protein [Sphingomonas abietis]